MKRTRQRQKNIARLAIQIVDERRQCSQLRVLQEREGHISDQSVQRRPVQHPVRCQSCRQQDHHIRIALRLGHIALDEVAPEPLPELEVTPRRSDQRLEVSRDQARHLKRATVRDLRKYVGMPLPPRKPEQSGYQRCPLLRRQCPASHQQQVDITVRAEPRRRTGAIEVDPDDPTGIGREHSVEYRLDQIVHINGDYAPAAPRGHACVVQPRTRIAQVESTLTRTRVRANHPSDQGLYTLNLNSPTSPSRITYSLPSMRTWPLAFASAIEPASMSWSKETISALMKPRSKSVWMTPAACGAVAPLGMVQARDSLGPAVR